MQHFLAEIEGRAFRIAQIATGNREDALDIVQDAMIKLVQKYSTHAKDEWKPLFYSILQTRILDWHRRQNVRNRFRSWFHWDEDEETEDFLEQQPANNASAPDLQLQDDQFMDNLNTALSKLPLRQQQVFLMRVWEGMDIAETAAAMQCSQSSVKTHYARALEKLRAQLEHHQ
ncbi:MAG TPA: RNA polymerase sigma factor [Methylotenera sp.]|nr:RNA polymerase sigma factor [Methylotenera sp.]